MEQLSLFNYESKEDVIDQVTRIAKQFMFNSIGKCDYKKTRLGRVNTALYIYVEFNNIEEIFEKWDSFSLDDLGHALSGVDDLLFYGHGSQDGNIYDIHCAITHYYEKEGKK